MEWIKKMLNAETGEKVVEQDGQKLVLRENFADARNLPLKDALSAIMSHAINGGGNHPEYGVRDVGDQVKFRLEGVTFGVEGTEEKEVDGGTYEIVVRRVE